MKNYLIIFLLLGLSIQTTFAQKIQEKNIVGKWAIVQNETLNHQLTNVQPNLTGQKTYIFSEDNTCELIYGQNPNQYKGTWQWDKEKKAIKITMQGYDYWLKIHSLDARKIVFRAEDGDVLYGYEHYEKQN